MKAEKAKGRRIVFISGEPPPTLKRVATNPSAAPSWLTSGEDMEEEEEEQKLEEDSVVADVVMEELDDKTGSFSSERPKKESDQKRPLEP